MKLTDRLYRWIDNRGRIPFWVRWIWPWAHWCAEMDALLILTWRDLEQNCFCSIRRDRCGERPYQHYENEALL